MKKALLCLAIMAIMVGSASAADWNFYGSARISTFYTSTDAIGQSQDSVDQYEQGLQGNSRFGATVKVSDELTAGFEYGTGVNVRKLYGEWDFDGGKFLVGQTYSPLNMFYSNQVFDVDNDLLAQGGVYSGREGMLMLTFGGFKAALVAPNTSLNTEVDPVASDEVKIPGIELSYSMKLDMVDLNLAGGYQTFKSTVAGNEEDVDTYVLALGAKFDLDAFYIAGNAYIGQNAGNMIAVDTDGSGDWDGGYAMQTDTNIVDNDAMGIALVLGYTLNDMFTFEGGYGFVKTSYDISGPEGDDDKAQSYYLNSTITMAPGVFVVPEIGVIDGNENGDSKERYFGAKWQINF